MAKHFDNGLLGAGVHWSYVSNLSSRRHILGVVLCGAWYVLAGGGIHRDCSAKHWFVGDDDI